jgi:hypothetical protein
MKILESSRSILLALGFPESLPEYHHYRGPRKFTHGPAIFPISEAYRTIGIRAAKTDSMTPGAIVFDQGDARSTLKPLIVEQDRDFTAAATAWLAAAKADADKIKADHDARHAEAEKIQGRTAAEKAEIESIIGVEIPMIRYNSAIAIATEAGTGRIEYVELVVKIYGTPAEIGRKINLLRSIKGRTEAEQNEIVDQAVGGVR